MAPLGALGAGWVIGSSACDGIGLLWRGRTPASCPFYQFARRRAPTGFYPLDMSIAEEASLLFVRAWAEAVLRQVDRVRTAREKAAAELHSFVRKEEGSPTEGEMERSFRELWVEEHTLIWTAHQLEQWISRLAVERGEDKPKRDEVLASARNALEHLNDADFEGVYAVPGQGPRNRSMRKLPGGRLSLVVGEDLAYGMTPEELEHRALFVVRVIEHELDQAAADRYAEMLSSE